MTIFKENSINIQIFAPELIKTFNGINKKKKLLNSFQNPNGHKVTFIIPKDFNNQIQFDVKKKSKDYNLSKKDFIKKTKGPLYLIVNNDLNNQSIINNRQITFNQLMKSYEYREFDFKKTYKCEIIHLTYGESSRMEETLKIKVIKINGLEEKNHINDQSSEDAQYESLKAL